VRNVVLLFQEASYTQEYKAMNIPAHIIEAIANYIKVYGFFASENWKNEIVIEDNGDLYALYVNGHKISYRVNSRMHMLVSVVK
jgi:hypothetical protein